MKWMKKCPLFLLLTVSGLCFSLVGFTGRFNMYKGYEFHAAKQPFLSLMMEGMDKGVAPWEACGISLPVWGRVGETAAAGSAGEGQDIADLAETGISHGGENEAGGGQPGGNGTAMGMAEGERTGEAERQGETAGTEEREVTEERERMEEREGMEGTTGKPEGAEGEAPEGWQTYEFQTVTEDYFNDAVFIGDSRTVGLYEYGGMEERADFFAKISLTIYDVFTERVAKDALTGEKITVEEALAKKQYGKVYLMLGINELGTGTTQSFMETYAAVVERIRELQPDAIIFVEGIMRVTGKKHESDPIFNNTNINEKNGAIAQLADNRDIFYIDVNEAVCDGEGNLNGEYTIDEIHLKAKYYEIWKEFLLGHGIVRNGGGNE